MKLPFIPHDAPGRPHSTAVLGRYRGRTYHLTVRVSPGFDDVEEFAVTVHYSDASTGEAVQVARIDTAHGGTHFDRLYRGDRPKDPVDVGVWEATALLEDNWRTYARSHASMERS